MMTLEKIADEIKFMIALILESLKQDFYDPNAGARSKKHIVSMMQQLCSILHKLNDIKIDDTSIEKRNNNEEDLRIIEDFLKNHK